MVAKVLLAFFESPHVFQAWNCKKTSVEQRIYCEWGWQLHFQPTLKSFHVLQASICQKSAEEQWNRALIYCEWCIFGLFLSLQTFCGPQIVKKVRRAAGNAHMELSMHSNLKNSIKEKQKPVNRSFYIV